MENPPIPGCENPPSDPFSGSPRNGQIAHKSPDPAHQPQLNKITQSLVAAWILHPYRAFLPRFMQNIALLVVVVVAVVVVVVEVVVVVVVVAVVVVVVVLVVRHSRNNDDGDDDEQEHDDDDEDGGEMTTLRMMVMIMFSYTMKPTMCIIMPSPPPHHPRFGSRQHEKTLGALNTLKSLKGCK